VLAAAFDARLNQPGRCQRMGFLFTGHRVSCRLRDCMRRNRGSRWRLRLPVLYSTERNCRGLLSLVRIVLVLFQPHAQTTDPGVPTEVLLASIPQESTMGRPATSTTAPARCRRCSAKEGLQTSSPMSPFQQPSQQPSHRPPQEGFHRRRWVSSRISWSTPP
jgi:hypothetical protein